MWEYKVREITKVVDGDTVDAIVDLGFYTYVEARFRLWGIDAPEVRGEEREEGLLSKRHVEDWLAEAITKDLRVRSRKEVGRDKYGRWVGDFYWMDKQLYEKSLSDELVEKGFASPMMDGGYYSRPSDPE